jgi:subtilisin family serine protease
VTAALRLLALCAILTLFVVGVGGAGASLKDASTAGSTLGPIGAVTDYVPGELIVRFKSGVDASARSAALADEGAWATGSLGLPGLVRVKLPAGVSVEQSAAALEDDPTVLYAEPNYLRHIDVLPNDPLFPNLYGLSQPSDRDIDAPSAWNATRGSSNVIVAVIDSGVAYGHPDLNDNMWLNDDPVDGIDNDGNGFPDDRHGWDFVQNDATPLDLNGHGTHVAGTIGAEGNNGVGVTGVNWDVSIMALRAADAGGSLSDAAIINSITYACANGADVVNGSFGGSGFSSGTANAIKSAPCANTLFVFAAGNSGWNLNGNTGSEDNAYPCEYHRPAAQGGADAVNVLCVAATGPSDALAGFSNRGASAVHLAAPGVDTLSTWPAYSNAAGFATEGYEGTTAAFNSRWGDRTGGAPDWNRTSARKKAGTYSLADSPAGNYPNNSDRTIRRLPPFSLAGRQGCLVVNWVRLDSELGYDGLVLMAGTTPATPTNLGSWSGTSRGSFVPVANDLSAFEGMGTVYLRLRFLSDSIVNSDGVYVDNTSVMCLNNGGAAYSTISGTSMATPHVAGVAGLALGNNPSLTVADLKAAVLGGIDVIGGLASHVSTSGRLNAAMALALNPDDTPPNTTITSRPANLTQSRKATFRFTASQAGSRFQCKHMNGAWRACSSPKTYRGLGKGLHKFQVRAMDRNGNLDPTPAVDTWRIR